MEVKVRNLVELNLRRADLWTSHLAEAIDCTGMNIWSMKHERNNSHISGNVMLHVHPALRDFRLFLHMIGKKWKPACETRTVVLRTCLFYKWGHFKVHHHSNRCWTDLGAQSAEPVIWGKCAMYAYPWWLSRGTSEAGSGTCCVISSKLFIVIMFTVPDAQQTAWVHSGK